MCVYVVLRKQTRLVSSIGTIVRCSVRFLHQECKDHYHHSGGVAEFHGAVGIQTPHRNDVKLCEMRASAELGRGYCLGIARVLAQR